MTAVTWFTDSPDAGPDCICSWCGRPILDIPSRIWHFAAKGEDKEARFHLVDCLQEATDSGQLDEPEDGRPSPFTDDGWPSATDSDIGPCCACGREGDDVRNIILLEIKTLIPGTGWGCVRCGLPFDGAIAALCDECLPPDPQAIKFMVYGYLKNKARQRIDLAHRLDKHQHFMALHPEMGAHLN